ncbi:MAG TPA: hypothetical protein PLV21_10510 [Cyclobacteriaceae bacterium]|nr:hypothetical protein [Cyclobacteriaceae bacterium]HRJ28246.1 hypothetical protein [Cyclobacteriaceae bacterium]HRJ82297.1 hypothetical protein [Cyclobacteriaceae bacterium]HRJ82308.1 hypothetical protein [Cyclobacteriaceae bacterium]
MVTFFDKYENESIDSAIDYLFSTNKWMADSKDEVNQIKTNLNESVRGLGKYYGYENISSQDINKNVKQYVFQLRYDLQPLRFKVTFYKPDNEWRVQNFQYDSKLIDG